MAPDNQISTTLQLNEPRLWGESLGNINASAPNLYFQKLFPAQHAQFGPAFLEMRETAANGFLRITPISLNVEFFAATFSDPALGLSVVYFEPEMQFYYAVSGLQPIYKPVSPEKLMSLYRGLLIRAAKTFNNDVNILNLFVEFRSDKNAKAVVQRAKSVLAADHSFFGPDSMYERERGPELMERVARVFVEQLLAREPGQILRLGEAYEVFRKMLKQKELPDIKRADFKAVVGPMITSNFNVALRNDLPGQDGTGVRGWKGVRLIQTLPR